MCIRVRAFSPGSEDQTTPLYYFRLARFSGLTHTAAGFSR